MSSSRHQWFVSGYQDALQDVKQKWEEDGPEAAWQWIVNNLHGVSDQTPMPGRSEEQLYPHPVHGFDRSPEAIEARCAALSGPPDPEPGYYDREEGRSRG